MLLNSKLIDNNSNFQTEVVTIYSGVTLIRCEKIRTLTINNPPSLNVQNFVLPLETDYPPAEINALGRRNSDGSVGLMRIDTEGIVHSLQVSGAVINFNNYSRCTATWIVN